MKLFLDTAHLSDIRTAHEWGILDGVTTNPSLAARRGPAFPSARVVEAARLGADCATMPFSVMERLFHHPLTDIGMARFNADWEAYQQALAARHGA